jgi:hypothetical protein
MIRTSVFFAFLFTISTAGMNLAAAPIKGCGEFCARAAYAQTLLHVLLRGVDQCFNHNQPKAMNATKGRLSDLGEKIQKAAADWNARNKAALAEDARILSDELDKFGKSPGGMASLYCRTNRRCLELGFEGNEKYPECKPLNGDNHRNVQYTSFTTFIDDSLPRLVKMLRQASR